jgi:UDPglucose 6-dehydrogenase
MNISIIGTGYVGLVTGVCLAEAGHQIIAVDIDNEKIKKLSLGINTIYEPGLDALLSKNVKNKRLSFTTDLDKAIHHAKVIFLALPTPPDSEGAADLTYITDVANKISATIDEYKVIVNKSTVPVGTANLVQNIIAKNYNGDFDVVSNPEFLKEGMAVEDFMKPDRIVIGSTSKKALDIMYEVYAPFLSGNNTIYTMDEKSAEITKYAANAYLATRISFMNEIANICDALEADVEQVRKAIGADNRIGNKFLFPGLGYGGSCFPKDLKALINSAATVDYDFKILKSVLQVNLNQKDFFTKKIFKYFNKNLKGKKIAIWGLAFKPNTDDIREAPALVVMNSLLQAGAELIAYDPVAIENTKSYFSSKHPEYEKSIKWVENMYDALLDSDALAIITEWNEFRNPDFIKMGKLMNSKVVFDGRNIYELDKPKQYGFHYESIGRQVIN